MSFYRISISPTLFTGVIHFILNHVLIRLSGFSVSFLVAQWWRRLDGVDYPLIDGFPSTDLYYNCPPFELNEQLRKLLLADLRLPY